MAFAYHEASTTKEVHLHDCCSAIYVMDQKIRNSSELQRVIESRHSREREIFQKAVKIGQAKHSRGLFQKAFLTYIDSKIYIRLNTCRHPIYLLTTNLCIISGKLALKSLGFQMLG